MSPEEFNDLKDIHKTRVLVLAESMDQLIELHNLILSSYTQTAGKHYSVSFHSEDIAVIEASGDHSFADAPFTFAVRLNDKWVRGNFYFPSQDLAYLGALGHKYHGPNSQFAMFAGKMLAP